MKRVVITTVLFICLTALLPKQENILEAFGLLDRPTGIGVIGDSFSEGYHCIGRGGPDSYAWTEVAQDWRGINFGPMCNGYNVAVSGKTTADIVNQSAELVTPIQNNELDKVIIIIGGNDIRPVCNRIYNTREIKDLQNNMLTRLEAGVIDVINAGMSPENITMVNQLDRSQIKACSYAAQVTNFVQTINVDIEAMANQHGIHVIAFQDALNELDLYRLADGNYEVAGYLVKNEYCDAPDCFMVADGHVNTVTSGIVFNSLFANVLGVARLSDEEIVMAAGLKPRPTPTATAVPPTMTYTPTSTSTNQATPTNTPTPNATVFAEPTATETAVPTANPANSNNTYIFFMPIISR